MAQGRSLTFAHGAVTRLAALSLLCALHSGTASAANAYADPEATTREVCMTCHGAGGQGNAVVGAPKIAGMPAWYTKAQLIKFREGLRGQDPDYIEGLGMAATVQGMSDAQFEALAGIVSDWPSHSPAITLAGNLESGRAIYGECAVCHGDRAQGNPNLGAPNLAGTSDWYLLGQLHQYQTGTRGQSAGDAGGAQMRAVMRTMQTEADLADVIAYINTL